jgi:hypothetical protein
VPLMKTGCCLILLFVRSICTDLDSWNFIRYFLVQIVTSLTADCNFSSCTFNGLPYCQTAVSSANMAMVLFDVVGTSVDIRVAPQS